MSLPQKKCAACGKFFNPIMKTQKYCKNPHMRPCPICGKSYQYLYPDRINQTCSKECAKELSRRTCMKHYGVPNPGQSKEVQAKYKQTLLERYGVENPMHHPDIVDKCFSNKYSIHEVAANKLPQLINTSISIEMIRLALKEFQVPFTEGITLDEYEFDLCLPEHNVLICLDSSINNNIFRLNNEKLHLKKTRVAQSHGYQCVHIFDWDNLQKLMLLFEPKTTVYARKCKLEEIDQNECDIFLAMFHLQGTCRTQTVRYGLYYDNKLIQVMTFGKCRYTNKYQWELLRLCTDSEYRVIGGPSKMFKKFLHDHDPESIVSYCDISKFSGKVYEQLGMELFNTVAPNKVWNKGIEKITDRLLCRVGYDKLFLTNFGKGVSNEQLMIDHGWLPVHDCGQKVFRYLKS